MATKNNRRWPTPRTINLPKGQQATKGIQYRVILPDGKVRVFKDQVSADAFVDSILARNPGYSTKPEWDNNAPASSKRTIPRRTQKPMTPARQLHFASEDLPVYIPNERKGIDRYIGAAKPSPAFQRAYNRIGMDPIFNDVRVENVARAWKNNPEAMQNWTDGGNAAAGFIAAPVLAYTAPTWAPWAGRTLLNGLKWRYTTPSGWALGAAAELPQVASAAEASAQANNPNGDNRSRLERVWDYAWDNPGKTFMTLAGLQATYNWANNKWGTAPEWKYGEAAPGSKGLVPYDANYANQVKSLPRTVANKTKGFVKQNWLSVPAAIYGAFQFGDWLLSNPDQPQNNTVNSQNQNQNDSTRQENTLPAGFRPIQGINDSGQVVVPSSSGRPDSIINIEQFESRFDE